MTKQNASVTPVSEVSEPEVQRRINWRNVFSWLAGILILALLVCAVIWAIDRLTGTRESVSTGHFVAPVVAAPEYVCNAVAIGTPVSTEGKCTFCTVNYSKPGEVFIAGETAIEYKAGAWVFQYNTGNVDGFKTCINGQGFMSDTNYQPIWK